MPDWQNKPPTNTGGFSLRILRTPSNKPIVAIATSTDVLGCITHFYRNRTIPCEGNPNCTMCQEGHSWRWHGYLAAVLTENLEHFMFEFTATASTTFDTYHKLHSTLRGCLFKASRPSLRHNGRVVIHCKPADQQRLSLPEPPDLKKILCHIWNIQNTVAKKARSPSRVGDFLKVAPGTEPRGNGKGA